jgi:type 1 fimbria pilin
MLMFESKIVPDGWISGKACYERAASGVSERHPYFSVVQFFLRFALVVLAGLVPVSAHAELTCNLANANKVLTAGTISVPVNTAPGTTIRSLAPDLFQPGCYFLNSGKMDTSATLYVDLQTTASLASGFSDVYNTGIAGLGIRYTFNSSTCNAVNVVMANGAVTLSCPFSGPLGGPRTPIDITVTSSLVAIGAIESGASSLSTAPVVAVAYRTSDATGSSWAQSPLYTGSATGSIIQATCSVSQPNIAVSLPNISVAALSSGVGATTGSTAFSLTFSCSAGARVLITLTDNANPANQGDALQLTSDSTAQGVGVQILNGTSPLSFGPDSAAVGNTNQWSPGNSPNGPLLVPLTARYIRTGTIAAGTVKSLATFTMSYQ